MATRLSEATVQHPFPTTVGSRLCLGCRSRRIYALSYIYTHLLLGSSHCRTCRSKPIYRIATTRAKLRSTDWRYTSSYRPPLPWPRPLRSRPHRLSGRQALELHSTAVPSGEQSVCTYNSSVGKRGFYSLKQLLRFKVSSFLLIGWKK